MTTTLPPRVLNAPVCTRPGCFAAVDGRPHEFSYREDGRVAHGRAIGDCATLDANGRFVSWPEGARWHVAIEAVEDEPWHVVVEVTGDTRPSSFFTRTALPDPERLAAVLVEAGKRRDALNAQR